MPVEDEIVREVAPRIFRVPARLPIPEVGYVNSYVIVGENRSLIVDPGMAHPACSGTLEKAIGDLGLDLTCTDFFITHHHLDHFSAVSRFLSETSDIYISKSEAEFIGRIASGEAESDTAALLEMMGFPERKPMNVVPLFFSSEYSRHRPWPFRFIEEGTVLEGLGRRFTCFVDSGHSIAHSCLFEPILGVLISGDQITAGIQFLLDRKDPLADQLQYLSRLGELDVQLALPGHGRPFKNHRKRIDLLLVHHRERTEAVYGVLGKKPKDAYEATLELDRFLPDLDRLDLLPPDRKFIRTRHTFAYLQHLSARGKAKKIHHRGRIVFSRC